MVEPFEKKYHIFFLIATVNKGVEPVKPRRTISRQACPDINHLNKGDQSKHR